MRKILLVEDDLSLIEGLEFSLSKHQFNVTIARTVKQAKQCLNKYKYNLIILDLMLPDGSGFEICKEIRQTSNVPIIFLTASDEEVNVVMGLDIGADDYITKPFRINELISRINALLRRLDTIKSQVKEFKSNGITVNFLEGRIFKNGTEIELTSAEYRLLCLFMKNPKVILSKTQIMDKLWDCNEKYIDNNTLAVYVSRLREKVEDNPRKPLFLVTIRGRGYKWDV